MPDVLHATVTREDPQALLLFLPLPPLAALLPPPPPPLAAFLPPLLPPRSSLALRGCDRLAPRSPTARRKAVFGSPVEAFPPFSALADFFALAAAWVSVVLMATSGAVAIREAASNRASFRMITPKIPLPDFPAGLRLCGKLAGWKYLSRESRNTFPSTSARPVAASVTTS